MDLKERIMNTMIDLVKIPGISGTDSENLTSNRVYEILKEIDYFRINSKDLIIAEIEGDPLKRRYVGALLRSNIETSRTIIITGHTDVVGIEEYGHLRSYAFEPLEYTKRIKELKLDNEALEDLKSGEWLFGRGVADMKYGIALGIELLRELSIRRDIQGNILFLAVPGEESNSEGMLGAVPYLVELQEKLGLEYLGLLLPEPYLSKTPKDNKRYLHIGACGKIMPIFFFVGKETHVSDPFGGFNPNLLASELNRLMELNIDFCEEYRDAVTPPPLCLKLSDFKDLYSVQTPLFAAAYYNLITLNLSYEVTMDKLKAIAIKAFNNALEVYRANRIGYEIKYKAAIKHVDIRPVIMTYEELYNKVMEIDPRFIYNLRNNIEEWRNKGIESQAIALNIMKFTYECYPHKEPTIIIGFVPPYYPDRYPDFTNSGVSNFVHSIDNLINYSKEKYNEEFVKENYFMGICDLSYTGLGSLETMNCVTSNMPGFGSIYNLPIGDLKRLDITGIVLGPYGKDLHKYTERINIPFSFKVLPNLYEYIIYDLLNRN